MSSRPEYNQGVSEELEIAAAEGLTPNQTKAAFLDGQGMTRGQIATACNISERTIVEWRKKPEYRTELARVKGESLERLGNQFTSAKSSILEAIPEAVETLRQAMRETDEDGNLTPAAVRAAEVLMTKLNLKDPNDATERDSGPNIGVINVIRSEDGSVTIQSAAGDSANLKEIIDG